jgi:hypothetical protein
MHESAMESSEIAIYILDKPTQGDDEFNQFRDVIDDVNSSIGVAGTWKYSLANFIFLLVLMGIEMDMAGLALSAKTYWDYNIAILKAFLFFEVFAFCAPLAMVTCMEGPDEIDGFVEKTSHETQTRKPRRGGVISQVMSRIKAANPFDTSMQIYHFFPGIRFYMLVKKHCDAADVNGVLKVNALSSFTLGVYQFMGIGYTFWAGKDFNLFIKMNVASQCLNWFITIIYYATPAAKWMSNGQQCRTCENFFQLLSNNWADILMKQSVTTVDQSLTLEFERKKDDFKTGLAMMIYDKYFDNNPRKSGKNYSKDEVVAKLKNIRDADVSHYIRQCKLHTIHCIG